MSLSDQNTRLALQQDIDDYRELCQKMEDKCHRYRRQLAKLAKLERNKNTARPDPSPAEVVPAVREPATERVPGPTAPVETPTASLDVKPAVEFEVDPVRSTTVDYEPVNENEDILVDYKSPGDEDKEDLMDEDVPVDYTRAPDTII